MENVIIMGVLVMSGDSIESNISLFNNSIRGN